MEGNAPNTLRTGYVFAPTTITTATLDGQGHKLLMQGQRVESERNKGRNLSVLKGTSGNATKWVKL